MRSNGKLETTVFGNETSNNLYLHWRLFALITWSKGTLSPLIRCDDRVCSNDNLLKEELHHTETFFTEINVYWKWLLKQTFDSLKAVNKNYNTNIFNKNNNEANINYLSDKTVHTLKLWYKSDHGISLIKSIKTSTKKTLPENYDAGTISTGTKLAS